ncbi:MAG: hypothetical protein AB7Q17_02285 [Phycisphaerae bacterium]
MNYLGHFALNHRVARRPVEPLFAMGVALPDLWPRFSRRRRIRWRAVELGPHEDQSAERLRQGLLNHAAVDRMFHASAAFVGWQRALKHRVRGSIEHSALLDFVTHVAIELAIDHHLLRADAGLANDFYAALSPCDPAEVERLLAPVGDVDARGMAAEIRAFVGRRALERYREPPVLVRVLHHVLGLVGVTRPEPDPAVARIVAYALEAIDLAQLWNELGPRHAEHPTR